MRKPFITRPHSSAPLKGKVCATILAGLLATASFGQGVGINTTTPDPSAALDIQATDKGILIPKVSLQSSVDNTTVPNPANGLIVYNVNQELLGAGGSLNGEGLYQNIGTPAVPNWESVSRFKLPTIRSASTTGAALSIANYNTTADENAAIEAINPFGFALKIDGKIKITGNGQSPKIGKVLTSDNNGNASWMGGIAFNIMNILDNGAHVLAPNTDYKVPFKTKKYDKSASYALHTEPNGDTFTAPARGIYHFNFQVAWDGKPASIMLVRNSGGTLEILTSNRSISAQGLYNASTDVALITGDQIYVYMTHVNESNLTIYSESFFNGRFVEGN